MKKEFGNVKGFDTAIYLLDSEEQSDLLLLISNEELFRKEITAENSVYSQAALALAAIYHANNEDK